MAQSDDQKKIDPQNLQATREALARADTGRSPAAQGSGTGTGGGGPVERGPADTAQQAGGVGDGAAPAGGGAAGIASGLQPGGMKPTTGAGGHGKLEGDISTPGAPGGGKR